jgi:hypothetical protein
LSIRSIRSIGRRREGIRAMGRADDLAQVGTDELAVLAEAAVTELARRGAFGHLLRLTRVVGESVGVAARATAGNSSWAGVADIAGVSRQAAWERWRTP